MIILLTFICVFCVLYGLTFRGQDKLEQLERLRYEDTPRRLMVTHTIDQFILLTSSYRIPSQNKVKAEKFAKNWYFRILS